MLNKYSGCEIVYKPHFNGPLYKSSRLVNDFIIDGNYDNASWLLKKI